MQTCSKHYSKLTELEEEKSKRSKTRNEKCKTISTLVLTQQRRGAGHRPAYSQARRLHVFWWQLQVRAERRSLHPHLKAHMTSQHTVGESAARPQRGELSTVPRLPARTVMSHLKVEVTVICTNKEGLGFKTKVGRSSVSQARLVLHLRGFNLTMSPFSLSASSLSPGGWGGLALVEREEMLTENRLIPLKIRCCFFDRMSVICVLRPVHHNNGIEAEASWLSVHPEKGRLWVRSPAGPYQRL